LARFDPADDLETAPPQVQGEPGGDGQSEEEAADLDPLGKIEEETQHRGHAARQGRWADGRLLQNQHTAPLVNRAPITASPRSRSWLRAEAAPPSPGSGSAARASRRSSASRRWMM